MNESQEERFKRSEEILHHIQCSYCKKYFTVSLIQYDEQQKFFCPWCGKKEGQ